MALGLAACTIPTSSNTESTASESPAAPETAVASPTPFEFSGPEKELARSRYQLDIDFDYAAQVLSVWEQIDYINSSDGVLSELLLVVEADWQGATFELRDAVWGDGTAIETVARETSALLIPLKAPLGAGDSLRLALHFDLELAQKPGILGYTTRQSNFADWYPFVPPRDETSWILHGPGPAGEHLVYESADFEVLLRVHNAPEELVVAAPAPAEVIRGGTRYVLTGARRFAWSASADYTVLESEASGVTLAAYVFPEHLEAGQASLSVSRAALELYEGLFGEYPYESLAIVEADFPDGMESDGLFWLYRGFFDDFEGAQNYLTSLSAHEVAHNWWFGAVGNDPALEPWLDEALALYSERLYYEALYPEQVDAWWEFRILRFSPTGAVDSNIYAHTGFASYVQAAYFRGALFLDALRQKMGDVAFFSFLRDYFEAGRGEIVNADVFFALLGEYELVGLDDIVGEYFAER